MNFIHVDELRLLSSPYFIEMVWLLPLIDFTAREGIKVDGS